MLPFIANPYFRELAIDGLELNKFLSKKDLKELKSLKAATESTEIIVTCMGLYNHGKSTLLNALIKDFEQKTFKTADVRETALNKAKKYKNKIFVDTPGLNAKEHDNKRVLDGIKQSDINLFVHTVTTGEFTESEINFLNKVKKHWKNPQEFIERTIFVISRVDKGESDDVLATINKMKQQIKEIFSTDSLFIPVSALRFINGNKNNKSLLTKKSNIEELENTLEAIALDSNFIKSITDTRQARLINYYDSLIKRFNSKLQENKLELTQFKRERDRINKDILRTENTLKTKIESLEEEI